MKEIVYYRATPRDIPILVDYRLEFLIEFLGEQSQKVKEDLSSNLNKYFNQSVIDSSYVCYLAKSGDRVVGIGGMTIREQPGSFKNPSGKVGYVMNMYTIPSFRRQGICGALLKHLIDEGKRMGLFAFELHATKDGEHVYPKHDFKIHSEPTYRRYIEA
jgi:GNAT superfamily N-acetyltransferase